MSLGRRFAGTGLAAGALLLVIGLSWWVGGDDEVPPTNETEALFSFEKEDLVAFRVSRPDGVVSFQEVEGRWQVVGQRWRPSASLVRRVAHQLHDLTARAQVVEGSEDLGQYGLGDGAIRVDFTLADGQERSFEVGDPNPSSVSWYLRPLPDGPVFVVKKAAVDYFRMDVEGFREDRFGFFDAADAESVAYAVAGQSVALRRTGPHDWEMTSPHQWSADRELVRRMLGSVSAARAVAFEADQPDDLSRWSLGPDADHVAIQLSTGRALTIRFGDPIPDTEPPLRYVYAVEDDAVYQVRSAMTDPFRRPLIAHRNPRVVGHHEWEVVSMRAQLGDTTVDLVRSADQWRWDQGAVVPGSTPKRVAAAGADPRALAFHDTPPPDAGLQPPWARLELAFESGDPVTLSLGRRFDEVQDERTMTHQYLAIDGEPEVYTVDGRLGEVIEDLHREHGRKTALDAERHFE